jgi:hypothetical protein
VNSHVINDLEGTFVFVIIGDEMQFGHGGNSHGVRMDMALDMVAKVVCRKCTGVSHYKCIIQFNQHDPICDGFLALGGTQDQEFYLLFLSWFQPVLPDEFHECRETGSIDCGMI